MQSKREVSGFSLAPQQKRMWSLQQNGKNYWTQAAILIEGELDIKILKTALQKIIDIHDILRISFPCLPGMKYPLMVINDNSCVSLEIVEQKHNVNYQILFKKQRNQIINFEQNCLLNCSLIKLFKNKFILHLALPSLCADNSTIQALTTQIIQHYIAGLQNKPIDLSTVQYWQFSEWHNQLLEEEEAEEGKAYWQQKVENFTFSLLPFENHYLELSTFAIDCYSVEIESELRAKIEAFAEQQDSSVENILLSVWQILLWRLTAQSELMIFQTCDRRDDEELHNLLGLVGTCLPQKIQLSPDLCFQDVLERLEIAKYNQSEWQDYFVAEPIGENNTVLFPLGFEFITLPESYMVADTTFSLIAQETCLEPFNVKLGCVQSEDQLRLDFYYNVNAVSQEGIERLAQQFQTLLINAIINSRSAISQLEILSQQERHSLLVEFNPIAKNYRIEQCIHHLFEQQATQTSNQIAVIFEEEQLTYSELNAKANQLAHYLQKLGIGCESVVGVVLERSLDIIIAMLGILKAGAAYLPLDPALPAEGLSFRLQDAKVSHVISDSSLTLTSTQVNIINLERDWATIATESQDNPVTAVTPKNLIYVLYTSGSTGQPKAVAVEHRHLFNYLQGILERLELSEPASFALISTFAADLGNTVIFPALCTGGCLHIISQERGMNPDTLVEYCDRYPIDYLKIVPSHLNALLLTAQPDKIIPKKCLILGGEALNWQLVAKIKAIAPNCRILNHYGPTETTVGVLTYSVTGDPILANASTVPLGRPLPHVRVYVLDEYQQLVPVGVPGELYIGGDSVTRGYLNRPQLTAERFLTHLFDGEKLYKTGDRVRYLPDGNIEFLGRTDNQVKLRGFRLELEEIEALLNQHEGVRQSVASLWEKEPGKQQLIAYIVPNKVEASLSAILHSFLKEKLSEYAIPSAFFVLKSLPLTPNGKIDRQALPDPNTLSASGAASYVVPRTSQEVTLARIWADILKIERVGIDDNFFQLGGHSLLATQVTSAINSTFELELPLRQLFEFPTIRELAERLNLLIQQGQSRKIPPIIPVSREQPLPLSFAQTRLWFLEQLHPDSGIYNSPAAFEIKGTLNLDALVQSVNEIIKRHEVLRTNFKYTKRKLCQVINPSLTLDLPVIDLSREVAGNVATRETEVKRAIAEAVHRPFNLSEGPLLRGFLLYLGEEDYVLVFILHHIIIDGWSTRIFIEELTALYRQFSLTTLPPLSREDGGIQPPQKPPLIRGVGGIKSSQNPSGVGGIQLRDLPIQYADYALWQQEWMQGEVLQQQLAYWTEKLTNLPVLSLPTICPRETLHTHRGATLRFTLPLGLPTALQNLSRQENVTLFMTLLAGFEVLLQRYTQQNDIVVGTNIANRNQPQTEGLIGFFVNLLVLRTDLSGNPNVRELLERVREVTLKAYAHQDLPFEKLVEVLQPDRHQSQVSPLVQVMFALQNAPSTTLELPGAQLQPLELDIDSAKFDLSLIMEETTSGIRGRWEYNRDLFEESMIAQINQHFQNILLSLVTHPEAAIAELSLLTEREHQQVLIDWNNTASEFSSKCLHQLIEEQVERTPDAIAVVFEEQQLTYRELNERANQLAHQLQKLGMGPEVLVGICVERSLEMVIGLLGILKAGGAYVPLDPAYPRDRIAYMIEDSQMSVIVTQKEPLAILPNNDNIQIVDLEIRRGARLAPVLGSDINNPVSSVKPNNLAYVIYTSGSTGKPKGVQIAHHSISNFLQSMVLSPGLTQEDTLLAVTTISFDIAGLELYLPLIVGAKTVIVSREVASNGLQLSKALDQTAATVLQATPATWQMLLSAGWEPKSPLKILCGGEALTQDLAKRLLEKSSSVWNLYGPTEATVWATLRQVKSDEVDNSLIQSIGRPIANTQIYILDAQLQPVPVGVKGEIYIGGVQLARGYLNRPELTTERFIPNPFSNNPNARLYKTGDLGRYRPDGNIDYLGRIDHQVKLRGFRIELGEIEALLSKHPHVKQAVVLLREDRPKQPYLVGYVVPRVTTLTAKDLIGFLKQELPSYMIPTAFVFLESLPQTPNGKIDRQALPTPDIKAESSKNFIAPRTPTETLLASIWIEVLKVDSVGILDNFFELGGHSLLAGQVISAIQEAFDVELPLRQFFESPTVEELAKCIDMAIQAGQVRKNLPISPVSRDMPLPLSFAQTRLWFFQQLHPDSCTYNLPAAVHLKGTLNIDALTQSINEIIKRHEALRTIFISKQGEPLQVIIPSVTLDIPVIDLSHVSASEQQGEVQAAIAQANNSPFDLSQAPLLRGLIFRLNEQEHIFALIIHHIVTDVWSMGVLIREFSAFYQAFAAGEPVSLPQLPIQYADFAVWQREWMQGEVLEKQLAYWKRQLEGANPILALPTDRPRPAVRSFQGAMYRITIPKSVTEALNHLSQQQEVTLFMVLLAAFKTLLYYYTKQNDILIGSPVANRNRAELNTLIGFFVNTLVMRTHFSNSPTFSSLLTQVRDVVLEAYANQDLPFDRLVKELLPERNLNYNPLFQVWFAFHHDTRPSWELPGLELNTIEVNGGMARHDLRLNLAQTSKGIEGAFYYQTDLFEEATIARMARLFTLLLEVVAKQPEIELDSLNTIFEAAEKQRQDMAAQQLQQTRRQKLGILRGKRQQGTGKRE